MSFDDIRDFDNIDINEEEIVLSNIYEIRVGGFGLNEVVKTYFSSVKVKDLKEDIKTFEELKKEKSWPVSQIIQREIDKFRVRNISKDYILGSGRLIKYFPPITIAILPKSDSGMISPELNFNSNVSESERDLIYRKSKFRNEEKIKSYFNKAKNKSNVEGIYLLTISEAFDYSLLCWDKRKYFAVVIDGQHRLESLFESISQNEEVSNFLQDVTFIDLNKLIEKHKEVTPVEAVRRIFVDINNTSIKVGNVRRVLMDDKDLGALLVQSIISEFNKQNEKKLEGHFLPSQIIDWYGENLKHSLPHLTGILTLYQLMTDYVLKTNLVSINELRSKTKVKRWIQRLNELFKIDDKIKNTSDFKDYERLHKSFTEFQNETESSDSETDIEESEIFHYDYRILEIAQDCFEKIYITSIVKFFTDIKPYKEAITILKEKGAFDKKSNLFDALVSSPKTIKENGNLKDNFNEVKKVLETELNKKYYLLFTVLGQKTLFNLLFKRIDSIQNSNLTEKELIKQTDKFITEINELLQIINNSPKPLFGNKGSLLINDSILEEYSESTIATSFWEGIIYQEKRIIYNSQGISSFCSLFEYILDFVKDYKEHKEGKFSYTKQFEISYLPARIKSSLKRNYQLLDDYQIESLSKKIVGSKRNFINKYLKKCLDQNKK